jgi:hypothetical protein
MKRLGRLVIIKYMINLIEGLVVAGVTQVVKKIPAIDTISEGKKRNIRIFSGVLSLIATVVTGYVTGTLAGVDTMGIISHSITNYIYATIAYYGLMK